MQPITCETVPRNLQFVQFDGNLAGLREFLPVTAGDLEQLEGRAAVVLRTAGSPLRLVNVTDWVSWDGHDATVHGDAAFRRFFRPVQGETR